MDVSLRLRIFDMSSVGNHIAPAFIKNTSFLGFIHFVMVPFARTLDNTRYIVRYLHFYTHPECMSECKYF